MKLFRAIVSNTTKISNKLRSLLLNLRSYFHSRDRGTSSKIERNSLRCKWIEASSANFTLPVISLRISSRNTEEDVLTERSTSVWNASVRTVARARFRIESKEIERFRSCNRTVDRLLYDRNCACGRRFEQLCERAIGSWHRQKGNYVVLLQLATVAS